MTAFISWLNTSLRFISPDIYVRAMTNFMTGAQTCARLFV